MNFGWFMEYIKVVNDKNTVIINDEFKNISLSKIEQSRDQKCFVTKTQEVVDYIGLKESAKNIYSFDIQVNGEQLAFISPADRRAFGKAFAQCFTTDGMSVYSPSTVADDFVLFHSFDRTKPTTGHSTFNRPEPIMTAYTDLSSEYSFEAQIFEFVNHPANYGMEIYNETGQLIFNSNNKYLRIKDVIHFDNLPKSILKATKVGRNVIVEPDKDKVIESYSYGGAGTWYGEYSHVKRYAYDEPVAICVVSQAATDEKFTIDGINKDVNLFSFFQFTDENTIDLYAFNNVGYSEVMSDDTGEGEEPNHWTYEKHEYHGFCPTLTALVIAKNDYTEL